MKVQQKYKPGVQAIYSRRVHVFYRAMVRHGGEFSKAALDADKRGYNPAVLGEEWIDAIEIYKVEAFKAFESLEVLGPKTIHPDEDLPIYTFESETSPEDYRLISNIADLFHPDPDVQLEVRMDLRAVHAFLYVLDLPKMFNDAKNKDFHDVSGINRSLSRDDLAANLSLNHFVPRNVLTDLT